MTSRTFIGMANHPLEPTPKHLSAGAANGGGQMRGGAGDSASKHHPVHVEMDRFRMDQP
jgi:hypothetical protein